MEPPKIRTYSRKVPIIKYASAATLVPSEKRFDQHGDVRPSCLNEKTLIVDNFNDTFDRLAEGVVIPSPQSSTLNSTSNDETKSESQLYDEISEKRNTDTNKGDNNLKVETISDFKVSKRKTSCSDEDSDSDLCVPNKKKIKILNIEKPKQDYFNKFFESKKKKIKSPDKEHPNKLEIIEKAQDIPNASISAQNDKSKCEADANESANILKELPPSRSLHSFLIPPSDVNLPTSTPRVDKTRTVLDVKNISPISFDKENYVSYEQHAHLLIQTDADQNSGPKINKAELSDIVDNPGVGKEFLKPQSRAIKSKAQSINPALTDSKNLQINCEEVPVVKENINQNNLIHSQSSENNAEENQACEKNSLKQKNFSDGLVDQLKDQRLNLTPKKKNDKIFENQSSVESPLLFDDPSYNQNQGKQNLLSISNTPSEIAKNLFKTSFKDPENVEFDNTNNESSYYPHEWSNEYDTSYGEFTEKNEQQNNLKFLDNEVQKTNTNSPEVETSKVENQQQSSKLYSKELMNKSNENTYESKLLSNNEEQVTNKVSDSKGNMPLEASVKLNNFLIPAASESSNTNDCSSETTYKTDESESKNISDKKLTYTQGNIDDLETVETNVDVFDGVLKKEGTLENNEIAVKELDIGKIIKKTCPLNLQICIKKLDDNYLMNRSPILSKRSFKKSVSAKKSTKNIKKNRTKTEQSRIYKYESNKKKRISTDADSKKDSSFKTPSILNENYVAMNSNCLLSDFKTVKVFITEEDIKNAKNYLKNHQNKPNHLSSEKKNKKNTAFDAKLNDPVKITMRRKVFKKWDRPLMAIAEADQTANDDEVEEVYRKNSFKENETSPESRKSKPIFLKPGKSWARSLSIINHFQNNQNLEEFAVGRGQNWRKSVQTVLNMQSEDTSKANSKKSVDSVVFIMPESTKKFSDRFSLIRPSIGFPSSPSRFSSLRFSMRIVPSPTRSTLTNEFAERVSSADSKRQKSVSRKTSQQIRRDTVEPTEDDFIKNAKDQILKICNQTSYLPFENCFPQSYTKYCRKIGEGVYGEVFMYEKGSQKSVIKIIPIEGDKLVNCEPQKKFHEILSEILITEQLHKLRFGNEFSTDGFVGLNRVMCVVGKYPKKLIKLWESYDNEKTSENDCPSMFDEDQLFIILDLMHGGQDLEAYEFSNASESYSIFIQTALALAVAEKLHDFEHRDLHWGNILISKTNDKSSTYKIANNVVSLTTKGVKVSIIDFTLSRMSHDGCRIFNDLAGDPTLFEAKGEYQFDIYRMMKDYLNNDWQQFNPYTNILWLDYTLDKMITQVKYKRKTSKIHKASIQQMQGLRKEILKYESASDLVHNCNRIKDSYKSD